MEQLDYSNEQLMTETEYSILLIRHTAKNLHKSGHTPPNDQDIAMHIGTTTETVTKLMRHEKVPFSKELFERVAKQNKQSLAGLLRNLIDLKNGNSLPAIDTKKLPKKT